MPPPASLISALPEQKKCFDPGFVISMNAAISYVQTVCDFWIHVDPEEVRTIRECILEHVKKPEFADVPTLPVATAGTPCLAFFDEDGLWYRAVVEEVKENGVSVHYVDYGNSCTVPVENLRMLDPHLSSTPAMALKCSLYNVQMADLSKVNDQLEEIAYSGVAMMVTCVRVIGDKVYVSLVDASDGLDVNAKLGLAPAVAVQVLSSAKQDATVSSSG